MTSVATSVGESLAPRKEALAVGGSTFSPDAPEHKGDASALQPAHDDAGFSERRVAMVDSRGLNAMGELAGALSFLWVHLDTPGPQHRGRLGLYIEEAIEEQLEKRGALPPGIQASTGLDASLSDQLYRARFVEMRGIALGIPSLEGITNLGRSLDAEDSAVLRWWIAATADRPVHLVISSENTRLRVYPAPVLFESLFEVAPEPVTPLPPSPSMAESSESMDLSDLPPEVEHTNAFGTQVATIEEQRATDLPSCYDEDGSTDVDLPDLDRALGLTPETVPAASTQKAQRDTRLPSGESPQLPHDDESPVPALASTQKDGTRIVVDAPLAAPESPSEMTAGIQERELKADASSSSETLEDETTDANEGALTDDLVDLDEDEFLKTLQEDSARAPHVEEDEADGFVVAKSEGDAERPNTEPNSGASSLLAPSDTNEPLPTKKILRNPFIRLANPVEAISDSGEQDSQDDGANGRERSVKGLSQANVKGEAAHAPVSLGATLAGAAAPDPNASVSLGVTLAGAAAPDPNAPVSLGATLAGAAAPDPNASVSLGVTLAGAAAPDPNDPFNQLAAREWKTWVTNLEAARGPKPLSVIERMFVTDYTRLREAVRRGVAAQSANQILDEWQLSFSKSYSQAFDALRARGKRPTMVLDIVEMAARLGRLQGAKRVQLLMVDGMRFDLGLMVQDRMKQTADASLAERLLLWSALPSVTQYQLELLGKGADGLKEPGVSDEPPALVARGAAARVPRRVRTGRLELFKLDVVEDCLREVGAPVLERMDSIADQTAAAITEHLNKQAPRTMVVAFGDHGFALDPKKAGTTEEVLQGGSSPEEVLVPAFAWLTGAVH